MNWFKTLGLLLLLQGHAFASSPNWQDSSQWKNWPTVGKATLSWLFYKIYKSELKSPSGIYLLSGDITPHPMALSIVYQRDITKDQLIQATKEQWAVLGYSQKNQELWLSELESIYTNVKKGEQLVYITDGAAGEFRFYGKNRQERSLGLVESEQLNDAFLSIWLSPATEHKQHRAKLIGIK